MTGRHPVRVGITDWIPGQNADRQQNAKFKQVEDLDSLPLEEWTLAEMLKTVGYQTYFVGKWHLGGRGSLPTDQGFDVNIAGYDKGSPPGGYYSPFKNPYLPDGESGEYLTERLTDESIQLIERRDQNKPFCLMFCYYNVHTPIEPYLAKIEYYKQKSNTYPGDTPVGTERQSKTRLRQDNPEYASMVAAVDESVGRIMRVLEKNNLIDNTVIVFTSDNGGLSTVGKLGPTSNLPLRAGKGWLYEGGIRVPLIISGVNSQATNTISREPIHSSDFFPTIAELADVALDPKLEIDGESVLPLLNKPDDATCSERTLYWHYPHYHGSGWKPGAAIREGDWKLIEFYEEGTAELYDLASDPGEASNLAAEKPELTKKLQRELATWQTQMEAKMPQPR
jgi:arylsulfatase A-like enzyme